MLSDRFKEIFNRSPSGGYDYAGYAYFWSTVRAVAAREAQAPDHQI